MGVVRSSGSGVVAVAGAPGEEQKLGGAQFPPSTFPEQVLNKLVSMSKEQ